MYLPSSSQVTSFTRHVVTAIASASGAFVMIGLSQGDATAVGEAVQKIGDGIASIWAGLSVLIPIATGLYASYRQSRAVKVADVAAMPGTMVTDGGKKITVLDRELQKSAAQAATGVDG